MLRLSLLASLLLASCSQAYSDGRATPAAPMMVAGGAEAASAAPYGVEIVGENGGALTTYEQGGRFYVLGDAGDRYIIHVTNPTDRRVEAVVTVDGLDVIDGEPGDLAKRGYVVPPHGTLDIEGFRTSTSDVATFRFSSVAQSYAGRKGKARNVGVIAVALFDEVPPQEIILEQEPAYDPPPVVYYDENTVRDYEGGATGDKSETVSAKRSGGESAGSGSSGGYGGAVAPSQPDTTDGRAMRRPPPPDDDGDDYGGDFEPPPPPPKDSNCGNKEKRGGLGTEYGEQRYSAATWTRFVRASDVPTAVAELRYNDAAGLAALGIDIAPPVDPEEVTKRETADPFPGDPDFSRPPR
jgi:hypothetical protein